MARSSRQEVDAGAGRRSGLPGLAAAIAVPRRPPPALTAPLPLSRTCRLADFPGCLTVADWQQQLAAHAWARWVTAQRVLQPDPQPLVVNYSGVEFSAPGGPAARYVYRGQIDPPLERPVPAIYALCVLERIAAPGHFLTRAASRLRPGGLLVLTFAYWDVEGPDVASGAADRIRIYDPHSLIKLIAAARRAGFTPFGAVDWTYHGHALEDHTLASLVLLKIQGRSNS